MKFIVEYENSRKKIILESLDLLRTTLEQKFEIDWSHVILQKYDIDEDVYLDIDELNEIENGDRLKIVPKVPCAPTPLNIVVDTVADASSIITRDSVNVNEDQSFNKENICNVEISKDMPMTDQSKEIKDFRPPWPIVFKIPKGNIGDSLKRKLEEKEKLDKNYKAQLFKVIYEEASKYYNGNNPDRSQYTVMVKCMFEDYPYLMGKASFTDAMGLWRVKLGDHFRNCRKRIDRNKPSVVANRLKVLSKRNNQKRSQLQQPYLCKKKNSWGIKNYLPERCEGEDDHTISQHMKILDTQSKIIPSLRKKTVINASMDKTFPERRKFILEDGIKPIQEIKYQYPMLFSHDQIFTEYSRLCGVNLLESFTNGIKMYSSKLSSFSAYKNEYPLLTSIRERIKTAKLESVREYYVTCCAITVVPQHLREKVADLFLSDEFEQISSYPRILLESDPLEEDSVFKVIAEGVTICVCEDLVSAYAAMFASYYIFNLSYPDKLKKTLTFFQKPILKITDKEKKDDRVNRFVTSLYM